MTIRFQSLVPWVMLAGAGLSACSSDASQTSSGNGGSGGVAPSSSAGSLGTSAGSPSGYAGAPAGTTSGGGGAASSVGGAANGGANSGAGSSSTAAAGGASSPVCTGTASYKVTVNVTWSPANVNDKHYTTIIGAVNSSAVTFWKLGGLATEGVKNMAEMGSTAALGNEVKAAIAAGTAHAVVQFGGGGAPGTSVGTIELSGAFPQVSFGSMLAPTPDWFVGVSSLSLCESGAWLQSKLLDASVYDAGTKDGADFDYGFPETSPPVPIDYSVKFPNRAPAGTIQFEKQ